MCGCINGAGSVGMQGPHKKDSSRLIAGAVCCVNRGVLAACTLLPVHIKVTI